jgi:DNA-binding NarL/FixJ family response regulator
MKVLLVEDDRNKERQLAEVVQAVLPEATLLDRRSYQSGLKEALLSRPEVILLDMSIPTFDVDPNAGETGGRTRPYGGRDLLKEIARRKLATSVVIVTQYDVFGDGLDLMTLEELKIGLAQQFPHHYVATVFYQTAQSSWREELTAALTLAVRRGS